MTALRGDLEELAQMEAAHGKEVLLAALERATSFSRFRAHDVRSIIAAGTGVPVRPFRARSDPLAAWRRFVQHCYNIT